MSLISALIIVKESQESLDINLEGELTLQEILEYFSENQVIQPMNEKDHFIFYNNLSSDYHSNLNLSISKLPQNEKGLSLVLLRNGEYDQFLKEHLVKGLIENTIYIYQSQNEVKLCLGYTTQIWEVINILIKQNEIEPSRNNEDTFVIQNKITNEYYHDTNLQLSKLLQEGSNKLSLILYRKQEFQNFQKQSQKQFETPTPNENPQEQINKQPIQNETKKQSKIRRIYPQDQAIPKTTEDQNIENRSYNKPPADVGKGNFQNLNQQPSQNNQVQGNNQYHLAKSQLMKINITLKDGALQVQKLEIQMSPNATLEDVVNQIQKQLKMDPDQYDLKLARKTATGEAQIGKSDEKFQKTLGQLQVTELIAYKQHYGGF